MPRTLWRLRQWKSLSPKHSRLPLPWAEWCGLALDPLKCGPWQARLGVLLMMDAYLASSELVRLRRGSLADK